MRSLDSKIYDKNYYLSVCLGSDEFKRTKGKSLHPRVITLLSNLKLSKSMTVLDIGCGRGDVVLNIASQVKKAYGIDYAKAAIALAKKAQSTRTQFIQNKTSFSQMNIKSMKFKDNTFDLVICIDVFEHLYKEELDVAMTEIKRVLKPGGVLFVHTGTNKILNDIVYPLYTYPMNLFLTWIDKKIRHVSYDSLPKNPRSQEEITQHVNEPTYFYLRNLFKKYSFEGSIDCEIGYVKEVKGKVTQIYNFFISLYPLSRMFPLNTLFSWVFICTMRNSKFSNRSST